MPAFTYYRCICDHCGFLMRIGDTKTAEEIRALLVSGDAVSSHSMDCASFTRGEPMSYSIRNETTKEITRTV